MTKLGESRSFRIMVFSLALLVSVVISILIAMFSLGPNIFCIGHIFLTAVCAFPIAILLFKEVEGSATKPGIVESVLPGLVVLVVFGVMVLYTLVVERYPRNIFRVFIKDPIPAEVTDIQARDISAGFAEDVVIVFRGSPELVNEIIDKKKLMPEDFRFSRGEMPDEKFTGIDWNADWQFYCLTGSDLHVWMWVDPVSGIIIYRQST